MAYSDLIIQQYRNKPKAMGTMELIGGLFDETVNHLIKMPNILNIEKATGRNLDLVGKHVGVSRVVNGFKYRDYFGFYESKQAKGFSVNGKGGGRWYRKGFPLTDIVNLDDNEYRWLIYAKIIKNNQYGTLTNLRQALDFLFGENVVIIDNYDMSVTIRIEKSLATDFTKWAVLNLDILPRQAGVKYAISFIEFDKKYFGFKRSNQAEPFNVGKWLRK